MKYGFIGCGNMGGAVARAVCKGAGSGDVLLANRTPAKAQALADELGCACGTNEEVAGICDFIFLGVKPQMMADMLDELTPTLEARAESRPCVLVTMAAGLSMQQIRQMAGSAGSALGTGGMLTKVTAAKRATEAGVDMIITNGAHAEVLYDIVEGKPVGTRFVGRKA